MALAGRPAVVADVDAGQKDNLATASGQDPGGNPVTDDGTATVPLPGDGALLLEKSGAFNDESGDGAAQAGETIGYSFKLTNSGNLTLTTIAVSDPIVSPISCPSGNPVPSLAAGATETCTGSYTLTQADVDAGQKDNLATASGQGPGGYPVTDDDTATVPLAAENPVIGLSKQVLSVSDAGGGQFDVALKLTVENLGNTALSNLQVNDDLSATFPAAAIFSTQVAPAATGTLTANPAYDGSADTGLLTAASSSLAAGAAEMITITVRFNPNGAVGPFNNTALASAQSPAGTTVTDISDDGAYPDPNGNGDPGDPGEYDPTPINITLENTVEIPTLSYFGLAFFTVLLAVTALILMRR